MEPRIQRILNWTQQYTRTDMNYLAKSGFWTLLKYVFVVIAGLITTIALANFVDPTIYGTYQYVLSVSGVLGLFTLTGMDYAINRAVAQGRDGAFRSGVRTKLKWSVGITIAATITASYYYLNGDVILAASILIAGTLSPLVGSFQLYEHYLSGKRHFKHDAQIEITRKLLPFSLLLIALVYSENVIVLVAVYFAGNAISYLLAYWYVIRSYLPSTEPDLDAINFSKHLSIMRIVGTISTHADKILIWHFLGAAAVAIFTIAQLATKYSGGILTAISSVALPKLAVRDLKTLQDTLPRKIFLFSLVMGMTALCYVAIAPFIFSLLFPMYLESIPLTQALSVSLLFVPFSLYQKALTAHGQTKTLYRINILLPIIKLGLLLTLLPLYQIWGAVYALLVSGLIGAITLHVIFARATSVSRKNN
jgi:O-antigen/teichoic acid export membrane protein